MSDVGRCIFKSVNILRMKDVYTFYVCVHMFKVIQVNISPSLQSTLDLRVRDHPYDTRGGELGDRKKAHWKYAHWKKAHRKKAHMYISAWEKAHSERSAHGKKRTRINPH